MSDTDAPSDTDQIFMKELKQEFKETVAANIIEMSKLYEENQFDKIAFIAHNIKGTAGHFELEEGGKIAGKLVEAARDKKLEKTKKLLDQLTEYMRQNEIID
ncbi:MAG: Hpt domain-containing protein [Candidatus Aminicenantes bacterium]|nr:MAG: Hpt domain-containing protein [Candidatus Aminicenantes bacterium]